MARMQCPLNDMPTWSQGGQPWFQGGPQQWAQTGPQAQWQHGDLWDCTYNGVG